MSNQGRLSRRQVLKGAVLGAGVLAAGPAFAASVKPYAGQKITVLHYKGGGHDTAFKAQLPDFEASTGIQAVVDYLPEEQLLPKVRTIVGAKSDEYDVIYYRPNLMPEVIKTGAVEPIDAYVAKSRAADKEFDYEDFIGPLIKSFVFEGKLWGLPQQGGANLLMYNKEAFKAAGLDRPPKTLDEMEAYAKKIHKPTMAGIAMRGKREAGINVFAWIFIWKIQGAKWYDNIKGNWFNEKWEPQLATREAIVSADRWAKMLRDSGPKGVSSYGWQECLLDFQQNTVAMWMDDVGFVSEVENPKTSKLAGKTGYAVVEGPGTTYTCVAPWGFILSASSKKREAGWEFMRWATGYKTQLAMVKAGYSRPSRRKVLESGEMEKSLPPEFVKAVIAAMAVADPAYKPLIPQQTEINDLVSAALSKILTGQATAEAAMKEANDKVTAIMKRDKYLS
ncbi:MAG TPA: sugar ABC transporter substrate-binding protein [Candidatus Acidoferrum sp.]|nr:sugar ABC transporter substrate-binding protein [Candidatus Acidoferrum sp.]